MSKLRLKRIVPKVHYRKLFGMLERLRCLKRGEIASELAAQKYRKSENQMSSFRIAVNNELKIRKHVCINKLYLYSKIIPKTCTPNSNRGSPLAICQITNF